MRLFERGGGWLTVLYEDRVTASPVFEGEFVLAGLGDFPDLQEVAVEGFDGLLDDFEAGLFGVVVEVLGDLLVFEQVRVVPFACQWFLLLVVTL
jgi:hypothetical protein